MTISLNYKYKFPTRPLGIQINFQNSNATNSLLFIRLKWTKERRLSINMKTCVYEKTLTSRGVFIFYFISIIVYLKNEDFLHVATHFSKLENRKLR